MATMSRRQLLGGAAALVSALGRARRRVSAAEAPRSLLPRELLFRDPDVTTARMSPDGRTLAYLAPVDGVRNVWVAPLDGLRASRPVTRATDRPLAFFRWAYTSGHVVFFQDRAGDENWRASSVDVGSGAVVPLTPAGGVRAYVQQASPDAPREMLLAHNARDREYSDLYRVDVVTGRSELIFENHRSPWLVTDAALRLRLAGRYLADGSVEWLERHPDGAWTWLMRVPIADVDATRPLGFSRDGRTLYMLDSRGRDKAVLVALDMSTRRARVLASDADADLTSVLFDEATGRPLLAGGMLDRQRWHAVDRGYAAHAAAVRAATAGDVYFVSASLDRRKTLIWVERDDGSPGYELYDHGARSVRPLLKARPALDGLPLRPLEPVVFAARDGLPIRGYLTRPRDGQERVPMVLVIHGGPYYRDYWAFDSTHQWLANRGYAVLSVNYRGSTGFGKAFVTAAHREWGGKMQDDLVDAVRWAVDRGIADPERVGFLGASYGGYAALTAATRTPETFACIVDIFGVANLLTFMAAIPPYWRPWFSVWKQRLGDPDTPEGRALLIERSPLTHIARASRPILIVQGLEDVRVTRAESEQIVAALRRRGAPVTYVTFPDEGHGFQRPENDVAFRAVTEAFLGRHLGGAVEPIDRERDFRGSTLTVEVGGELVPGLVG